MRRLTITGSSFLLLLGASGCSDESEMNTNADAGTDSSLTTIDSSIPVDGSTAEVDFTPWSRTIGASVSFYSAASVRTDPDGNVIVAGGAAGNRPFATTTEAAT
jgi:hypothetical protein